MRKKSAVRKNCSYNILKQLVEREQFLWNVNTYIEDAEKAGHDECKKAMEELRENALEDAETLKEIVEKRAKQGEL